MLDDAAHDRPPGSALPNTPECGVIARLLRLQSVRAGDMR
jgi:hypothetical protein